MVALLIGYESMRCLTHPVDIEYRAAIPIAVLSLAVNLVSAFLLHDHPITIALSDTSMVTIPMTATTAIITRRMTIRTTSIFNIRPADTHVVADAVNSLLAITALAAAAYFGLPWFELTMDSLG
jgi:Co/Zn/Cd efflux system component